MKDQGSKPAIFDRGWKQVVCCASGPSLSQEQMRLIHAHRADWKVIVINTTWQMLPTADVLYAGDRSWWETYIQQVRARFEGECWTCNRWCAHHMGLHHVDKSDEPGLCKVHGRVHTGGNSGHAAIGLAYLFGARRILLVGYDFQDTHGLAHWHGDHPPALNQTRPYRGWLDRLPGLVYGLRDEGVHVVNCSTTTAIPEEVIPRGDLAQCLCQFEFDLALP